MVWGLLWPDPKAAMKKDTVSTSRLFLLMVFVVPSLTWQKGNHSYGNMPLCHTTDCDRCWGLNSHCFHIVDRDKLINPIVGLSIPIIIRIPITKGGMSLMPNIRSWLTLAHMIYKKISHRLASKRKRHLKSKISRKPSPHPRDEKNLWKPSHENHQNQP